MLSTLWSDLVGALAGTLVILAVCVTIEIISGTERFNLRDRGFGLSLVLTGAMLAPVVSWPLQKLWYALGLGNVVVPLWQWLQPLGVAGYCVAVTFFVMLIDFLRYWRHRAEHRWFWNIHKVHHSPTDLHAANSIGHPLQVVPDLLFVTLPLSLIQFPGAEIPFVVGFMVSLLSVYIHSPVSIHFGRFRRIVVDNRFHRIHHSVEERHFDKNFSVCFSLWDALFGTAHWPAPGEWPKVGVEGEPFPRSVSQFLIMPFMKPETSGNEAHDDGAEGAPLAEFSMQQASAG